MSKHERTLNGASVDSIYLIIVKLVTTLLSLAVTRILAGVLSITEYGTYSQIMLLISTISAITTCGMIDGANYFFYRNGGENERERFISTIFFLQYVLGAIAALILFGCSGVIIKIFGNVALRRLLIFAALIPVTTNSVFILQVLFVAVGKARQIAIRNLLVSIARLVFFWYSCTVLESIAAIFIFMLFTDIIQIVYFRVVLRRNGCSISMRKTDLSLVKSIFSYCIPMAAFIMMNTLSRDIDRYVVSFFTDTETLAVYANASKVLPFDIVMASFVTVLVPYITGYISEGKKDQAADLYRSFLEISYMTTAILAGAAMAASPMLMRFLYSEKYMAGLSVFRIYIAVDIVRFLGITIVLSSAGKTARLMKIAALSLGANVIINIIFFKAFGIIGPAFVTLMITFVSGVYILRDSAHVLDVRLRDMFDFRNLCIFAFELLVTTALFSWFSYLLDRIGMNYILIMFLVGGGCAFLMSILNMKRILSCMCRINNHRLVA